jgi:hypothetical protein
MEAILHLEVQRMTDMVLDPCVGTTATDLTAAHLGRMIARTKTTEMRVGMLPAACHRPVTVSPDREDHPDLPTVLLRVLDPEKQFKGAA